MCVCDARDKNAIERTMTKTTTREKRSVRERKKDCLSLSVVVKTSYLYLVDRCH